MLWGMAVVALSAADQRAKLPCIIDLVLSVKSCRWSEAPPKKILCYDEDGLIKKQGLISQITRYAQVRLPAQIVKFYHADGPHSRLLDF